jgi:hypothetical protein
MGTNWAVGVAFVVAAWLRASAASAQEADAGAQGSTSGFRLGLHARATQASARAERAAWLTLAVPLGELAAPRVAQTSVVPPAPTEPAPEPRPALLSLSQLRAFTSLLRQAKGVALGVAGAAIERRRLDAFSARARASAALPELRVRAQRDTDQALRWAPTSDDPYRVTQADGAGTTLEASLTFQLDRLVFSREELQIERLRADAAAERLKLEARVSAAVFGLYRARELSCVPAADDVDRAQHLAELVEHIGSLDDLTSGWFSARAPSFSREVWGFPEAFLGACSPPGTGDAGSSTKAVARLENSE